MSHVFLTPHKIVSGRDALNDAAGALAKMGRKALVVTDGMMEKLGNVDKVCQVLEGAGVAYSVFVQVNCEPTDQVVDAGLAQYREAECDFLVAIGGGSPIDTMKAIAMLAVCGGRAADYMGKVVEEKLPAMAAIPTTAGTGSEATQFTIITDTATEVKMLLKGPSLLPELAIIDPQFTLTAPPAITAATGVDAFTHAIEAYTSRKAQPISDTFALSAVKRIFANLKQAYDHGDDVEARIQMSIASLEAGIAFNNSSVTIVHGMSRPIGALFHVPHGLSNAMLLEECLRDVACGAVERFADLARQCRLAGSKTPDEEAKDAFIAGVAQLLQSIDIPTLAQYGIDRDAYFASIDKMAQDAFDSGSPSNTRKEMDVPAIKALYERMWK